MPYNPAIERLQTLSSQLSSIELTRAPIMATVSRDPITCHVLDTTTGRPAANMAVKLFCCAIPDIVFECKTNADGRIGNWANVQGPCGTEGAFVSAHGGVPASLHYMIRHYGEERERSTLDQDYPLGPTGSSLWKLQFDTAAHYGAANTFFPV